MDRLEWYGGGCRLLSRRFASRQLQPAPVHGAARSRVRELQALAAAPMFNKPWAQHSPNGPDRARLTPSATAGARRSKCSTSTQRAPGRHCMARLCADAEGLAANSVASFADGSIVATVLFMPGTTFADAIVALKPTGAVFDGRPATPLRPRRGTQLPNNGIEARPTAARSTSRRRGCRRSSRSRTIRAAAADDSAVGFTPTTCIPAPDGRLVTAGMANDVPECGGAPGAEHDIEGLAMPAADDRRRDRSQTMQDTVIATRTAGLAFSIATMVVPVGRRRGSARSRATASRAPVALTRVSAAQPAQCVIAR